MKWSDLAGDEWTIAVADREKGTPGKLKLSSAALAIIERQPHVMGSPYVFAGRGRGPFYSFSQRKRELDAKLPADIPDLTLHDLRRTAKSLMARAGVTPHVSERVLGHAIAGVEGVYDVHDYTNEKADALAKLAALVETIINPPTDNVVALQGRKRGRAKSGGR
jgi:integrase